MLYFIIAKSGGAGEKIFSAIIIAIIFAIGSTIYSKIKESSYQKDLRAIQERGGISAILSEVIGYLKNTLGDFQIQEDSTDFIGTNNEYEVVIILGGEHYKYAEITIIQLSNKQKVFENVYNHNSESSEIIEDIKRRIKIAN